MLEQEQEQQQQKGVLGILYMQRYSFLDLDEIWLMAVLETDANFFFVTPILCVQEDDVYHSRCHFP